MIRAGAVLLLAVDQSSGFVGTSRRHKAPSSRLSARFPSDGTIGAGTGLSPMTIHLSREATVNSLRSFTTTNDGFFHGLARKCPEGSARRSGRGGAVGTRKGMVTQLGGWSYARTVLSNVNKDSGDGGSGADANGNQAGASTPAASHHSQRHSGGDGNGHAGAQGDSSSAKKGGSKSGGVRLGGGGGGGGGGGEDGGDDKDGDGEDEEEEGFYAAADSWDLDSHHSDEGVLGGFSEEEEEFEVVCDGDVCERKPVGPKLVHAATTADIDTVGAGADAAPASPVAAGAAAAVTADNGESGEGGSSDSGDSIATDNARKDEEEDGFPGLSDEKAAEGAEDGGGVVAEQEEDPGLAQLVAMGWEADEAAVALAEAGGDVVTAAEALAEREEEDLERYKEGLADLQQRGWDEEVAMSAMREAAGNSTAALLALEEEDRMLSEQFDQSVFEMVEHGWDEEVARKALLMQWQKDIEGKGGSRKAQKQFEKTVQGVKAQGKKEGKDNAVKGGSSSGKQDKKKDEPPAPTPAKREDVVFDVTDKTLQKVVLESPVPVILDVYAEWCGPCKQLTPALEEAAMRSGGMFRVAKVDADKQRSLVEVLGVAAFPSIFGLKNGIIIDNFVGILPQDEMQSFMMGVIMGLPPSKDKELREHQRGQVELRGMSRKLAHVAGLAVLGSRKKENLCLKVDKALGGMLPDLPDGRPAADDAVAVVNAKKAARTVVTVLMSAYKFPEDPKFRKLSTSSKVYEEVLSTHPLMLEVLRLAGFRQKEGDESHLHLMHRNMAVLASVQDRVEVWNRSVKMPEVEDDGMDDEYDSEDEEDEAERQRAQQAREHLASVAKLQITAADPASAGKEGKAERVLKMEMPAESTLGELFRALQDDEGFGDDLVLTTTFPKRELAASDDSCHASTLQSLGLAPSARLTATNAAALASEKDAKGEDAEGAAARKEELRAKMMDKSRDGQRKSKKAGTLFGASDGIIEVKKSKHREYFGGDSTITLAAEEEEEEEEDEGGADGGEEEEERGEGSSEADDFGDEGGTGGVSQSEAESDEESQSEESLVSFEGGEGGGISAGSSESVEEEGARARGAYGGEGEMEGEQEEEEEEEGEEEGEYDSDVSGSEEDFSESAESYSEEDEGRGEGEDYSGEGDWSGESDEREVSREDDGEMIVEVSEDGQFAQRAGQDSQENGDSYDDSSVESHDSYDPDEDESDYTSDQELDGESYDESDYDESDGREKGRRKPTRSQRDRQ